MEDHEERYVYGKKKNTIHNFLQKLKYVNESSYRKNSIESSSITGNKLTLMSFANAYFFEI